jgi:hypothetical protein
MRTVPTSSTTRVEPRQREQIDISDSMGASQAGAQQIVTDNRRVVVRPTGRHRISSGKAIRRGGPTAAGAFGTTYSAVVAKPIEPNDLT